jgi:hypothetical protein
LGLVRVTTMDGITTAKIVKSKTRLEAPGIEVARNAKETTKCQNLN